MQLSVNGSVRLWLLTTTLLLIGRVASQTAFQLKLERMIVPEYDSNYVTFKTWMSKVNRTTHALNFDLNITKELGRHDYVGITTFEFLNNEYRPFAINFRMAYCDFLEKIYTPYLDPEMPGRLPTKCPVTPKFYSGRNIVPNGKGFPINLPLHKSMLQIQMWNKTNAVIFIVQMYGTLDQDAAIRARYSKK